MTLKLLKLISGKIRKVLKFIFGIFFRLPSGISELWLKLSVRLLQVLMLILVIVLCINFNLFGLFGPSPKLTDLKDPEISVASELFASDGSLIGKYYLENRSPVEFSDLSPVLVNTLLSAEDIRFYKHNGIDIKATVAAIWSTARGEKRGGSTITQQLVKNLYKTRHKNQKGLLGYIPGVNILIDKSKEWINALKLEFYYSKNDILTMYLNTVDFGSHAFGIKAAAATFFDRKPAELKVEEAAVLIGLLKAPTYYSPVQNPDNALKRRNSILLQLERYGYISQSKADSLIKTRISLRYRRSHDDDDATYFKEAVARSMQEWSKESGYNIFTDGLKIYTTIDPHLQDYAEQAVIKHMRRLQKRFNEHWQGQNPWVDSKGNEIPGFIEELSRETSFYEGLSKKYRNNPDSIDYYLNLPRKMSVFSWNGPSDTILSTMDSIRYYRHLLNTGFVSMDPATGYIKAWVGGIDFRFFKYDHVNQARRQPGSLFKAFVYTAAFEQGLGPCDRRTDQPVTIKYTEKGETKTWSPHNSNWNFTWEDLTLKNAFARSVNSVAVQLTNEMGWGKVIECAHRMGINSPLRNVPSVCLGSSDVTLLEMVNAYCSFLNDGMKNEPVLVTKIIDRDGKVIYEYKPASVRVISAETAFLMSVMLRSGLTEAGGTTQGLWEYDLFNYDTEFGGKTGTSSNFSDGWFIGITPRLVSGVWVGGEHRNARFRTSQLGEGLRTALPVFGLYMEKVLQDENLKQYRGKFSKPSGKINKPYSCSSYSPVSDSLLSEDDPAKEQQDSL
ncbi:MAG: transglycosylase domain-containing protein [Bacteroidales bacterium]|nr:transglycosylase domain-containing protein [Bacteroidales bacterium]